MPTAGGIVFVIEANSVGFHRKMAAAKKDMQSLGTAATTVSKQSQAATATMLTGASRLEKAYKRVRTVMVSVAVSLGTIAGLAAIGKLVSAAIEFETAFAGVQKTVDATQPELAALREEIRQMAKEIPLTTTELSKIAEVGGQLGIPVQNLRRFTEIIAKLGVATTMTIEDAAMSMARFAAIMRTSEDDYERLASTLVHLGNNFAATEQEIMTMSLRIAGAGKQVGMTEDQVLSLATALTAVGIRAEAGGTAISRTMIEIDKQVAIAGEKLTQFAKVAGLGVAEFSSLWKRDAMAALQLFIEGLARLEARGGNASIVLQKLGLGAVRVSDTLRRASSAHELLNETLKFGAEGWRENIALQREAEIRFATAASQFKLLGNRINDLAISIGDHLAPAFLALGKTLTFLVEQTWAWKIVLDLLLLKGLVTLLQRLAPLLIGAAASIGTAAKATALWAGSLTLSSASLKAQWAALGSYIASLVTSTTATTAATVATARHATGVAGLNAALTGNLAATAAATSASTQFGVAATTAATATKGWAAALSFLLPYLAILSGFLVGKWIVDFIRKQGQMTAELEAAKIAFADQQEVLKQMGVEVDSVSEKSKQLEMRQNLLKLATTDLGAHTFELGDAFKESVEEIDKETKVLKQIETTMRMGIGTWKDYAAILSHAKNPAEAFGELARTMLENFKAQFTQGKAYNEIVAENIESIQDLLFFTASLGMENNNQVLSIQELVDAYNKEVAAIDPLLAAYNSLSEAQKKVIDKFLDAEQPIRTYVKGWEDIAKINKEAGITFITIEEYARQFSAQIIEAAEAQIRLGKPLDDNALKLYKLAKSFESVNSEAQKFVTTAKAAINPSEQMGKQIRALQAAGWDMSKIVRLYGSDIIEANNKTRGFNQTVNAASAEAEVFARMLQKPIDKLEDMEVSVEALAEAERMRNIQAISMSSNTVKLVRAFAMYSGTLKGVDAALEELGRAQRFQNVENAIALDVINKMIAKNRELGSVLPIKFVAELNKKYQELQGKLEGLKDPIDALRVSLGKGLAEDLDRLSILPGVVAEKIAEMEAAGLNAAQIMHLFGGSIKEAAEWLSLMEGPLTADEQKIVDLAAAATDTSKIIQKQISTIITDLGKGFADIIVQWEDLWGSLKDIAKDFAKGILRIFFESLFTPIMQGFSTILSGQGFMGGFQGAGGFSGIKGLIGALGGLFTQTSTSFAGGFTDAAAGMTMMDTAATTTSLSLAGLGASFGKLGGAIAGAGSWMWSFISGASALGPWGTAIAAAAVGAVVLWKKVFSKSAYEKFAQEFARDFGDIVISDDAVKNFANSLGITEEQLAKVRKDVASSPAFLKIGYDAAVAQGKVEQFLTSLESIETAWGTFNFRKEFEEGINTGNWLDLNEAFVEAFGTDLLESIFGPEFKGLLIEMDEEMVELVLRTRELHEALETLRNEPTRVAAALDTLVSSIQILRDAGATDAEIMQILGEDMKVAAGAANQLEIAIPPVIQELLSLNDAAYGLSEAFQEGYGIWDNIIQQGQNLSDTIMGVGARMLEVFAPATTIIDDTIPSITGLSTAFDALDDAARSGVGSIPDLMENVRIEAEKLKAIVPESVGSLIDAFITQAEATAAGGVALQNFKTAASALKESTGGIFDNLIDGLIQQVYHLGTSEQAWLDMEASLDTLKDRVPEAMHPMIEALRTWAESIRLANVELDNIDTAIQTAFGPQSVEVMRDVEGIAEAQLMTWSLLGGDVLALANSYAQVSMELPPVIQLVLDWAIANKHAMESTEGHYIAIGKLSAAYQEGVGIWQNFVDKGWALQDTLMGLGDQLLLTYDAADAQRIAWQFLGDDIIALANSYDGIIDVLPPVIQLALEYAEAAGYIERNSEGAWVAVEGLTDALEGLNEQQVKGLDAWNQTLTATQDLADFIEGWSIGAIGTLGFDLSNVDDQTQAALLIWNQFGEDVIKEANDMISKGLGDFIDARTLQMLEWARAMGLVTQTADGMWKAIEGPGSQAQMPDWLQQWAAEMDAIYGPNWREWGKDYHGIDWSGTSPIATGGEIPEFPFPDPEDYPISETAQLSTRMGELKDVLMLLINQIRLLTGDVLGLVDAAKQMPPPVGGLPSNPPSPLNPPGTLPEPIGPSGDSLPVPLGPGMPSDPTGGIPIPEEPVRRPIRRHFGDEYVSHDMIALLQKGERVIPANENTTMGQRSQTSGVNVNVVIQGPVYGMDDLDRKIANSVRKTFKAGGLSFLGNS